MWSRIKTWADWLFTDKSGSYAIVQFPNISATMTAIGYIFIKAIHNGVLYWVSFLVFVCAALTWCYLEVRFGDSRFRKLLGVFAFVVLLHFILSKLTF